jgi:prepilin-type N-terminal cleavage/methylation domain-containing protein
MRRLLRRLRSEQSGFTLIELLVATTIGSIVMLASFFMLDSTVKLTGNVTERTDATQRARLAMDRITRELRSQVCPQAGEPAIIDGQDYSVSFYAFSNGTGTYVPDKYTIYWDTNSSSIVEQYYKGTGVAPFSWPATPTRTRTLLTDVTPPPTPVNTPIFKYYSTQGGTAHSTPLADKATRAATTIVTISFKTFGSSRKLKGQSIELQDQVYSRTADPNGTTGTTQADCA